MPAGVYNSNINNAVICDDALVSDTRLLANSVIHERAVVFGCGTISCSKATAFGNGLILPVGVEVALT
jgi:hypothetical protein